MKMIKQIAITILAFVIGFFVGGIALSFKYCIDLEATVAEASTKAKDRLIDGEYARGFNHALRQISLVNLEFSVLKNKPKTFGELADICRERSGIEKPNEH